MIEDVFVLTVSFPLHMLRLVTSGRMRAEGSIPLKSKNLFVADAKLYNAEGNVHAFGSGDFRKSRILLSSDIGYH